MSYWTHIRGTMRVSCFGRTQHEVRYILETVLDHLPAVTGSEEDMTVSIVERNYNIYCSHNEFGVRMPKHQRFKYADTYLLVVDGDLRDRVFAETYREFIKWLMRLAKRVWVDDVVVDINDEVRHEIIRYDDLGDYVEGMSWNTDGKSINWCEYLLWEQGFETCLPMALECKYTDNESNNNEFIRRLRRRREEYEKW